jgi:anti-anti-sigma factor
MDEKTFKIVFGSKNPDIVIIQISGYIDQSNSEHVDKSITQVLNNGKTKIVLDLSNLNYISSAGWGVFVGRIKSVHQLGGNIKIAAMQPQVLDVFQMLEFFHIIEEFDTVEEAVASYSPAALPRPRSETIRSKEKKSAVQKTKVSNNLNDEPFLRLLDRAGLTLFEQEGNSGVNGADSIDEAVQRPAPQHQSEKSASRPARQNSIQPLKKNSTQNKLPLADAPLSTKIKAIITKYPLVSVREMKRILRQNELGHTKIGYFKLRKVLKSLRLGTKEERFRYFQST